MGLAFIYPALPVCPVVYVQKSDFHFNVLCSDYCKTFRLLYLAQVVSQFVLHSSKIPFDAYDQLHICAACCSDSQMDLIV